MRKLGGVIVAVLLVGGPGCALDRAGLGGPRDGGTVPQPVDGGGMFDGGGARDAGLRDGGAHDGGPLDAGFDAGPPDAGPPPLCPPLPELVACYPLDGDALDHGPRGNHLTATGVGWLPGGGAQLGPASGLSIAHRAELAHASTTMLAWVRVDAIPGAGRAGILDRDGQYGIFVFPNGDLHCSIAISGAGWAVAPGAIRAGEWQHVACVVEGTMLRLYVGGAEVATTPASPVGIPGISGLNLGENGPAGDDQLIGALDDVRIFDAQWDATKVREDAMWGRRGG